MVDSQIIEIFQNLDKNGTGRIGREDFRAVCSKYLDPEFATTLTDDIFSYLNCDSNGEVSLSDLLQYVNSDRDNSIPDPHVLSPEKRMIERRRSEARIAWRQLIDGHGESTLRNIMSTTSGRKLEEVYHELQTQDSTSPNLVIQFEGALSSLLQDVKQVLDDNEKLKEMFNKEKEKHREQLRGLEAELDAHVAQIEEEVQDKARRKFELQKREIMNEMDAQMNDLENNLKISQKMNQFIIRNKEEHSNPEYESTFENNYDLYATIMDTKANQAILRSEMAKIKADYETKCRELNDHQEIVMHYIDQSKHVQRQLALLQQTNRNLQDANDSLLSVIEKTGGRVSPYCGSRASSETNSILSEATHSVPRTVIVHDTLAESKQRDALAEQMNETGAQFVIQRLMEDIDSGHSTLRGDPIEWDSADRLSEGECAFKSLESDDSKNSNPSLKRRLRCKTDYISSNTTSFETNGEPDRTYKVVFAGDASVGKSCFIHRFCKGIFANRLGSTLGVDFQIKTIRIDEKNIALQLWDTAGQERFRSMTKTYFRRADGIVLIYDTTQEKTFLSIREWICSINEMTDKKIPILICGNKVDLRDEMKSVGVKCVDKKTGLNLAQSHEAIFYETSSKTGENIMDALIALSREMSLREDVEVQTSALALKVTSKEKSSPCCSK